MTSHFAIVYAKECHTIPGSVPNNRGAYCGRCVVRGDISSRSQCLTDILPVLCRPVVGLPITWIEHCPTFLISKVHVIYLTCFIIKYQAVTQLLEALRYKQEGRGVDSRWCHWHSVFHPSGLCVVLADLASNKNEYQEFFLRGKGGLCVGLTT